MYRERIGRFIADERAKLHVPKNGGLNDYVRHLLKEIGVGEDGGFDRPGLGKGELEIIPTRGEDVGQRVEDCVVRGETAYGLTGDDLFDEYRIETQNPRVGVLNTYDWYDPSAHFNRPALCLMNARGKLPHFPASVTVAVNKKYERISRLYFAQRFPADELRYKIVAYAGDTENTVAEGTHDWCVEVVYRGEKSSESAMSKTGLRVVDILRFSDISLIGRDTVNPWAEEYGRIQAVAARPTDSRTSKLIANDNEISKKVGEEAAEYVRAFALEKGIEEEFNDVIYGLMVAAARKGVDWRDIERDLKSRWT